MLKINPIALIGGCLIFIGMFLPWFSFYYIPYRDQSKFTWGQRSPFTSSYRLMYRYSESVIISRTSHFYGVLETLIGLICIFGAILGSIYGSMEKKRVTYISGVLTFLLTVFSFITLPVNTTASFITIKTGWYMNILGALLIIISINFWQFIITLRRSLI